MYKLDLMKIKNQLCSSRNKVKEAGQWPMPVIPDTGRQRL
jgi:hypothetical protein